MELRVKVLGLRVRSCNDTSGDEHRRSETWLQGGVLPFARAFLLLSSGEMKLGAPALRLRCRATSRTPRSPAQQPHRYVDRANPPSTLMFCPVMYPAFSDA